MIPDLSIKKKPRRWRRWLPASGAGLAVLFVASIVSLWLRLLWEQSQGRKELAAAITETDEQDVRWRWEEIQEDLDPIPNAENSMLLIGKVKASFGAWEPGEMKLPNGQLVYRGDYPSNRRLDEQRLAVLRDQLGKHEQTVALAATLKDYPRGRASVQLTPDVLSTLLPHVQPVREVVRLLELDAERLAHDGRLDRAAHRIRAMLHASAGLRDDPFLISQLVRIACRSITVFRIERLLGMGEFSDEACLRLMRHVAAERRENLLLVCARGDRAGSHHLFRNLTQGRVSLAEFLTSTTGSGQPTLDERASAFLYSYRLPEDHANMLRWGNQICDIARLPFHERAVEWELLDGEFKAARAKAVTQKRLILSGLLMPAVNKVDQAIIRDQAQLACAEVALAAERFRLAHERWPRSLDELSPAFLVKVLLDPYTGDPLLYARREDGVVIYSVGPDLVDGGGEVLRFRGDGNYDVGLRLFNPDKRNLPPVADPARP